MVSHTDSFVEIWQQWEMNTVIISKYIKDYLCKYLNLRCLRRGSNMLYICYFKKAMHTLKKVKTFSQNWLKEQSEMQQNSIDYILIA